MKVLKAAQMSTKLAQQRTIYIATSQHKDTNARESFNDTDVLDA